MTVYFDDDSQTIKDIKSATGIHNNQTLADRAIGVYWLLLSLSIDNTIICVGGDGVMVEFALTKDAERINQEGRCSK